MAIVDCIHTATRNENQDEISGAGKGAFFPSPDPSARARSRQAGRFGKMRLNLVLFLQKRPLAQELTEFLFFPAFFLKGYGEPHILYAYCRKATRYAILFMEPKPPPEGIIVSME